MHTYNKNYNKMTIIQIIIQEQQLLLIPKIPQQTFPITETKKISFKMFYKNQHRKKY